MEGVQPIRVLRHDIVGNFENFNYEVLPIIKILIEDGKFHPGITYYTLEEPISFGCSDFKTQTPCVKLSGKILIHETYLSYLWIVCYSLWVLYDEAVAKPIQIQQKQNNIDPIDKSLISKAEELLQYGKSLIVTYSKWDIENLPNPERYTNEDEFYILRTNAIFIYAITFILYHELAHVEKGHTSKLATRKIEDNERIQFEVEADNRAIELMLKGRDAVNGRTIELGILMGLASMLFFSKESSGGRHHPDLDIRINSYLQELNPTNEEPIWGVASLFLKLWDNQFNLDFNWPKHINDFKELFNNTLTQVADKKRKV